MRLSEALLSHAQWWFHIENPLDYDPHATEWTGSANKRLRIYSVDGISYIRLIAIPSLAFNMTMLCFLERQIVLEEESERNHHGKNHL